MSVVVVFTENMALKTACNSTHNAVCTCIDGYMCNDQECTQCVLIPPTTKTTVSATISKIHLHVLLNVNIQIKS